MISVEKALELLSEKSVRRTRIEVLLQKASGCVLAVDVHARFDMPVFDVAAVDGYAVFMDDIPTDVKISMRVIGEIKAGDPPVNGFRKGTCCRIFTGAPVPKNALSIIMQEQVQRKGDVISVTTDQVKPGSNIRKKGNHFRKGDLVLTAGTKLNAAAIGLLASLGYAKLVVFSKPAIGLLVTGNELQVPGKMLSPGQIYESNSFALKSTLEASGFAVHMTSRATDRAASLDKALTKLLKSCEVIIITGGISVGEYDLVYGALKRHKVKELFYKVAQKPGKPFFTGFIGNKAVFALPGNPAAVLVCCYQYVLPYLKRMMGHPNQENKFLSLPITHDLVVKGDRAHFLRAFHDGHAVTVFSSQDSDNLFTFAKANALVYLSKGQITLLKNAVVTVYPLHD